MEYRQINLKKFTKEEIGSIADFLIQGKVVVYPTDTIYGIGCLATNAKAIKKIFRLKKREKDKALLILVSSLAMAKKYCRINKAQEKYLKNVWLRDSERRPIAQSKMINASTVPTSVILEGKEILPKELSGGLDSQAVRLPKKEFLLKMIKKLGVPLVSTSLNLSGQAPVTDASQARGMFKGEKPDLIIDGGRLKGRPSKLIDLRDMGNIKIIRK